MLSFMNSSASASSASVVKEAKAKLSALSPLMASMTHAASAHMKKKKIKTRDYGLVFDITGVHRPVPRLIAPYQVYHALMTASGQSFTSSASVPTYYAAVLTLTTLANYGEYTGLFDQYWIKEIEAWIEPSTIGGSNTNNPIWYSAIDLDDGNTPTAAAQVQSKQTAVASSVESGHYHRFKPHVAVAEYGSGAFTSYGNVPSGWVDSASPAVAHYGIKIEVPVDPGARTFNFTYRVMVAFREAGV